VTGPPVTTMLDNPSPEGRHPHGVKSSPGSSP
jgi:hypothetical protein